MLKTIRKAILHPTLFFELGNLALAFGFATSLAIGLNTCLVIAILVARYLSVTRKKTYDISYGILAAVGFFTAGSVIYKAHTEDGLSLAAILAALTYIFWGIGHLCASYFEHRNTSASIFATNPQFHYGIGDMLVVNVKGSLNIYSFPFTVLGFIKSLSIGNAKRIRNKFWRKAYMEVSSARIYAIGFLVGAITTLYVPYLFIAQLCWAMAYLQFGRDS